MNEPLWSTRDRAPLGRRRTAPRAESDGDVTRMVGVLFGACAAAIAATLAVALGTEPNELRAPGPLAKPHREAAVACASCHRDDDAPIVSACVACHGPHPSTRKGHRAIAERGELPCTRCHRIHRDEGGVAIDEGLALRYGPGREQSVALSPPAPPLPKATVPVIPIDVCDGCHDPSKLRDPIARCLLDGQESLGDARPTACFDEHRTLAAASFAAPGSPRERLAAWEVARRALLVTPVAPRGQPATTPWWTIAGIGLLAGVLGWTSARLVSALRGRRRARARVDVAPPERVRLPQINTATCIGCSACVDACPYDVLELHDYVAEVVRPADCCGLVLCEQRCPNGSLVVAEGGAIEDRAALDADLQSIDVPGLYLAGDLTGLPLIKNAINQGAHAVRAAAAAIDRRVPDDPELFDVAIIGAGPAGVSAALEAQVHKLRTLVLEQGSVAESIRSFPRGKLVFDQPLGIPMVGELWLKESTKEELLAHWLRIVRQRALPIREGHRVIAVEPRGPGRFAITSVRAHEGAVTFFAKKVIVAIGKRGTPRKLVAPIPDALVDRVHYGLADAKSLAGQRVVIVGLGDVAMEAAIALCHQPSTSVTMLHRGDGFTRGKARNVAELRRLHEAGRVAIHFAHEIAGVRPEGLVVRGKGGDWALPWDRLLVMIGALPPWQTLESMGVRRVGAGLRLYKTQLAVTIDRPDRPAGSGVSTHIRIPEDAP
ncbi:MAG TPA: NAD(P)-binding domain-containing protein [Nannocystaceae bacterium]|nr:NAD(P)-binding domain-containing protein [Nannocystaceae bacterium]